MELRDYTTGKASEEFLRVLGFHLIGRSNTTLIYRNNKCTVWLDESIYRIKAKDGSDKDIIFCDDTNTYTLAGVLFIHQFV